MSIHDPLDFRPAYVHFQDFWNTRLSNTRLRELQVALFACLFERWNTHPLYVASSLVFHRGIDVFAHLLSRKPFEEDIRNRGVTSFGFSGEGGDQRLRAKRVELLSPLSKIKQARTTGQRPLLVGSRHVSRLCRVVSRSRLRAPEVGVRRSVLKIFIPDPGASTSRTQTLNPKP